MKKYILGIILTSLFIQQSAFADNVVPVATAVKTATGSMDFSKSYKTSAENLLYLLLAAINAQNYSIEEIQFKTGSVLFKAYQKEFIASIANKDGYNSFIKIIPADNNYNFSPVLLQKLHNYIESNNGISFQKIL
jgi:hypothetical protein